MKKIFILCYFLTSLFSLSAIADARSDLQQRLNKVNNLQTNFIQVVKDAQGKLVQEGKGQLWLKQPDLFRWHMMEPDESILVSDGKTLWFYDPFVEQVTASWLNDAAKDTPLILITHNNAKDWSNYIIIQVGDKFDLSPRPSMKNLRPFSIIIDEKGTIDSFETKESDGQTTTYKFTNNKVSEVDSRQFSFTPPNGVTVDDQRQ